MVEFLVENLPLALLGGATYATFLGWAIRRQRFGTISRSRATQSLASVGVQVAGGLAGLGVLGLILGAVSNMASGLSILWRTAARGPGQPTNLVRSYWRCPAFSMPMALLSQTGRSAPTLLISGWLGSVVTGQYSLGSRIVGLPMAMISGAVSSVFLSRAREAAGAGGLDRLSLDTTRRLSGSAACLFGALVAYGPALFSWVFGARWTEAGHFIRILSPWYFVVFIFSPQTTLAQVAQRQGSDALWQGLLLVVRVVSIAVPAHLGLSPRHVLASFAATNLLFGGAYYGWIISISRAGLGRILMQLTRDVVPVATVLCLAKLGEALGLPERAGVVVAIVALVAVMHRRILATWRPEAGEPSCAVPPPPIP